MMYGKKEVDVAKIETHLRKHVPAYAEHGLNEAEKTAIRDLYALGQDETAIVALLSEAHRPQLLARMQDDLGLLRQASDGVVPLARWLDVPGWEGVQTAWTREQHDWKPVTTAKLKARSQTATAEMRPDTHEIAFRQVPSTEPIRMVAAEEVIHADQLSLLGANENRIESWVRERFGKVVMPDHTPLIDRDWKFHWRRELALKRIPEGSIRYITEFLLERDAMYRKLPLYKSLIATHPELRTRTWDEIATSANPKERITHLLNEKFHLDEATIKQLADYSLEDVIRITGGKTRKWVEFEKQHQVTEQAPARNSSQGSETTPAVFRRAKFYGKELADYVQNLPEPELAQIISYIRNNRISDIYGDAGHAILILQEYDRYHGTSHAIDEGARILKGLRDNRRTGGNDELMGYVVQAATNSPDAKAASKFVDALYDSPSRYGFVRGNQWVSRLSEMLQKVRSPIDPAPKASQVLTPPNPEFLSKLINDYIEYHQGIGQNVVDNPANGWKLVTASSMARIASDYYKRIGDETRAQEFENKSLAIKKIMDLLMH
jgi:hypothetical protein